MTATATPSIAQDVVSFVESTGSMMKDAEQLANAIAVEEQQVKAAAPKLAAVLLQNGLIEPGQVSQATEKLASHSDALSIMGNVLKHFGEIKRADTQKQAAAGNGRAVTPPTPAKQSSTDPSKRGGMVGRRLGDGEKSAADNAFEDILLS